MRKYTFIICGLMAAFFFSCAGKNSLLNNSGAETKTYCFNDSCERLLVSLSLELPMGDDDITQMIRDSLLADFMYSCRLAWYEEEGNVFPPYKGDMSDIQAMVDYYGKTYYSILLKYAMDDYKQFSEYILEDSTLTEAEKQEQLDNIPMWMLESRIDRLTDTLNVTTYNSLSYVYYGGAHGGIIGTGAITFDKRSGHKISRFIRDDAEEAIQPFLLKGLQQYYMEYGDTITEEEAASRLIIDSDHIPLPVQTAYPNTTKDSLILTYKEYEIACYADGMPSFRIAVKDIEKYLTEEGKQLLK